LNRNKLNRAYQKKDKKREELRKKTLHDVFKVLEDLSKDTVFDEAYIFGSVAEESKFSEHSDVDIAFKGLNRDNLFQVVSFVSDKLGRDVNVVHLEDIHFKEKIIREGIRWKRG
jgi:predicted nucleotidyltransferase